MSRSIQEGGGASPSEFPFPTPATSPTFSARIWGRRALQNAIPRIYDSKRRNNYCKEYEEYKRIMINLWKMYPQSPVAELEFEDWVDMRLARVEDEKKFLQNKIKAAAERSRLEGNDHVQIKICHPVENLPVVDWDPDRPSKIKSCPERVLPPIDFGCTKSSFAVFGSGKHHGQQAGTECRTETGHDGHRGTSPCSPMLILSKPFSAFGSSLDSLS